MKRFTIEIDGERQVVQSLEGYVGAKLIATEDGSVDDVTGAHVFDSKASKWKRDASLDAAAKKRATRRNGKADADRIDELEDRLEALELLVKSLSEKTSAT